MTCIVGYIDENKNVYIGGDSAGVCGTMITLRKDPKVFQRGEFLFGFTTSYRMGQLLMCDFKIRKQRKTEDTYEYMVNVFIPSIRKLFEKGGFKGDDDSKDSIGGTFLVGYRERLFKIEYDFQVGERFDNYNAIGAGEEIALGSLYTSYLQNHRLKLMPEAIVEIALTASEKYNNVVRRPFLIKKLEIKNVR